MPISSKCNWTISERTCFRTKHLPLGKETTRGNPRWEEAASPTVVLLLHILMRWRASSEHDPAVLPCCLLLSTDPAPMNRTRKIPSSKGGCMNLWAEATEAIPQSQKGACVLGLTPGTSKTQWVVTWEFTRTAESTQGPQGNMCMHGD